MTAIDSGVRLLDADRSSRRTEQQAMSGPVMACLDDGPHGAAAARVGASLATRLGSRLVLATVTASDAPGADSAGLPSSAVERARSVLLRRAAPILMDAAAGVGPDPEFRVEVGEPSERLVSLAQQLDVRLLVIGVPDRCSAPGRTLGSSYLALPGTSPCPVVAVPPSVDGFGPGGPIVCGVHGSDDPLDAVWLAVKLGRSIAAPVRVVQVPNQPKLSGTSPAGVELDALSQQLADLATRDGAQLLVVGSNGSLIGSASSSLVHNATQPVVLVRSRTSARPALSAEHGGWSLGLRRGKSRASRGANKM